MFAFQILTGIKVLKLIQIILISAVKFLFAPLISFSMGFNYIQTMIYTTIGGVLGVLFFFFLSKLMFTFYKKYFSGYFSNIYQRFRKNKHAAVVPKVKRKFTFRNKSLIFFKSKTGMVGIALLTPILLSIPLGTFLASKYYSRKKHILIYLSISVAFWSFVLSTICKLL